MKHKIFILDDELSVCTMLSLSLSKKYYVRFSTSVKGSMAILQEEKFDLVLLDLLIGAANGIDVLKNIRLMDPNIFVIMMTAHGRIPTSVEAIGEGAFTSLVKPLDIEELVVHIEQALKVKQLMDECSYLRDELNCYYSYHEIVGNSPLIQKVYAMIEKPKDSDASVIICGESGTGKELVARALHQMGNRRNEHFVAINCAAMPENLVEDELFGHIKGTFTGAVQDRKGKLEYANKGTLFLDEIGDMPIGLQAKLLRVIQQKEYSPIGSNKVYPLDIRFLAATNKDLEEMIREGTFRQDLYFRLNVMSISMPPLRERKEDIPLLCSHFLRQFEEKQKRGKLSISPKAIKALVSYDSPGNVRQLANILEHATILCSNSFIEFEDLPDVVRRFTNETKIQGQLTIEELPSMTLQEMEKLMIEASLCRNHNRKNLTAAELGISLRSLYDKIRGYGIQ